MPDVMMKPEDEAALAAETVTATKYYYYFPTERKAAARDALRDATRYDFFRKEEGAADVVLERLWNVLVNNY